MADVIADLIHSWKKQGTEPAEHKATQAEITAWETCHAVLLPVDLRDYVARANGIRGGENLEFDGEEMISLLPLAAMVPEAEYSKEGGRPGMFVIADHCISCYWWCAQLTNEVQATTRIYFGGGLAGQNTLIASSLEEFFRSYMDDTRALQPSPPNAQFSRPRKRSFWRKLLPVVLMVISLGLTACHTHLSDPSTVRFLIESSPTSLDLREGTDAQAERIGALIYDALARKDEHFNLQPWLATGWDRPDPLTWVFHLRPGVRFQDGKPLTADDVAWSIRSMTDGTLITAKGGAFAGVERLDVTGPLTLIVHTKHPDAGLLFNLSDGLFGVVERGAGRDEGLHPVGTGPFRFVSQLQDRDVLLERNPDCWAGAPKIARVRFDVVPDNITTALEMKKGSADAESNAITLDEVHALQGVPGLQTETAPGSVVIYANFNVADPTLRDPRVRQAVAYAINKPELIAALWRGSARPADSLLPPSHWARADDATLPQYSYNPAQSIALLDAAGLKPDAHGMRLRFTLKTSTDETTRLLAQALQQEWAAVGIAVELRSAEFGTFYADITHGAFQMYILRWIGSNEDPDIFRYAYATASFPPSGGNRGHYTSEHIDALLAQAAGETDPAARRREYVEVQENLAHDLPSIPLWYPSTEVVHSTRLVNVHADAGGTFQWLREAGLH